MFSLRRLVVLTAAAALPALGLALAGQATASAAPNFQVPFKCGVTVTAATFSGHNPEYSVDFQKSGITGMPVVASVAGTVTRVEDEGSTSYGKWIELDHGGGWRTRYAHLSAQEVSVGQQVAGGKEIGKAGATGGVTGPHLHFEERLDGVVQKAELNGVAVTYYGHKDFTSKNDCGGNPYSAEEVCGRGFSVVDAQALGNARTASLVYKSVTNANYVTMDHAVSVGAAIQA